MKKKKRKINLKKKLWGIFSRFIRLSHADENGMVRCFTCGALKNWKEAQAGHYHHGTVSLNLYFDERNVKPQCVRCNMWLSGNGAEYALGLQRLYGPQILETLDAEKNMRDKYYDSELQSMIDMYKMKLKSYEL